MEDGFQPNYLLMGTFLSAEQAWHLLHDSNLLLTQGRFANAFVLSVSCIEEVGESRMRLELTERALQGHAVSEEDLKRQSRGAHLNRLRNGHSGPVFVQMWGDPAAGSEEEQKLAKKLKKKQNHRPDESHVGRCQAQYVDPDFSSLTWNRPASTTREDAGYMLTDAAAEYSVLRVKLLRALEDPEFQKVASQITLPVLLEPYE